MSKPFDYSKWDNIELSDDEDDVHPNIDKESWFRLKHRSRVEREDREEKDKKKIKDEVSMNIFLPRSDFSFWGILCVGCLFCGPNWLFMGVIAIGLCLLATIGLNLVHWRRYCWSRWSLKPADFSRRAGNCAKMIPSSCYLIWGYLLCSCFLMIFCFYLHHVKTLQSKDGQK